MVDEVAVPSVAEPAVPEVPPVVPVGGGAGGGDGEGTYYPSPPVSALRPISPSRPYSPERKHLLYGSMPGLPEERGGAAKRNVKERVETYKPR